MKRITGSICALATPFRGGALDLEAFGQLIDHQLAGGTQGFVVAGSTGEAHALDPAEFDRLVTFAVQRVAGSVPVLAGAGSANTRKTIEAVQRCRALGADAALVVTPYYVRPTQEGLVRHFSEVADHGGLPIVLYNVPSRTGCDLSPAATAQLAAHDRIVGIKEAIGTVERVDALVKLKSAHFSVLSGDDPTALHAMLSGAEGVISVAVNLLPAAFRSLCDAALGREADRAVALNEKLIAVYDTLALEPNPIPLKFCLNAIGIGNGELRLPLTPFSAEYHDQARRVVAALAPPSAAVQPRHSSAA